ncbi:hypothetical protein LEP1GSC060_3347 [Leptospira weilii serovar Ranarum str. ICFT]|uniref:Lipoprotein n=1 Tax=Leptospira weilii serovar Ranarum str. ICFT TaxID=1218598 RepID=N1WHY0_9LEPT|nr:hypothetical protein [Leptospira weilii]EMY76739.1 hypothetical protein LEP1GSC060_3347 [Leptospira weilii serovar Ranarum str. ICFT]
MLFLFISFGILGLVQNCSSNTSSYYYSQKQIEYGDLNFHHTLKVNEYINAFPQDEIVVPLKQDLSLQVHSFSNNPNSNENTNLIQISVKTRFPNPEEIAKKAKVQYLEGSRISTIGLGYDVNQNLLRTVAENGQGHYYFADNAKTLTKIIRDDFETLVVPIAKKVILNIHSNPGYKILKIYGATDDTPISSNKISLNLGELNATTGEFSFLKFPEIRELMIRFRLN